MFGISGAGYDHSTGIFSPEGRIFAAEYAKKAVEQGATSIGIQAKDGIILLAEKRVMPLQEPDSVEKISKIDDHIGVATSGFMADARQLIQEARIKAQSYWLTFDEPIPGEALAEHICNVKVTRLSLDPRQGGRPYGVAMLIGSVDYDGNPRLYMTDPVGYHWGYMAAVIGRGSNQAGDFLESHYKRSIKIPAAIRLGLDALRQATDSELDKDNVEIAKIPIKTRTFTMLSDSETEKYLSSEEPVKKTPE
ncbi:MAG: archaeal proteasome endopeptidase complex subunit alpha [Candidatus Thorarchaeota archaeon]|nr:archaeal proteasome endopeptidase complex subunit alpha [Candidatus Thorarchaeota archaeon]